MAPQPFQLFLSSQRPIPDSTISSLSGLTTYTVPDVHYQPDIWVYFDFVRRVTATPQELEESGISFEKLGAKGGTVFSSQRATERVNFYYNIFKSFALTFGTDTNIPFLSGAQATVDDTTGAKQDTLNNVIRHFITNVSVRRTSTGPSTASITIAFPTLTKRAGLFSRGQQPEFQIDSLLFWNHFFVPELTGDFTVLDQLITPMTWVYVYGRGRLDPGSYYPMFTGLVSTVTQSNQGGYESLEIVCDDTLKFLHKTVMRVNPALAPVEDAVLEGIVGENFAVTNHILTSATMQQCYEYILLGGGLTETGFGGANIPALAVLDYKMMNTASDISAYERVRKIRVATSAGGTGAPGVATSATPDLMARAIRESRENIFLTPKLIFWGLDEINPYRAILPARTPNFFGSDFVNRLEACREVANRTMTEFYADAIGHYNAHPYRHSPKFLTATAIVAGSFVTDFTTDVRGLTTAYVISYDETRTSSFTLSDQEIATVLLFTAEFPLIGPVSGLFNLLANRAIAVSEELGKRFGFWIREHQEPLVNEGVSSAASTKTDRKEINKERAKMRESLLKLYALARLAYLNKDLYNGNVVIFFRPELEVARPVYFPERRDIGYIMSIDHNFPVGGDPTTGIGISFVRKTDALPIDFTEFLIEKNRPVNFTQPEINKLLADFSAAAGLNRSTGRALTVSPGYPSVESDPNNANMLRAAAGTGLNPQQVAFISNLEILRALLRTSGAGI